MPGKSFSFLPEPLSASPTGNTFLWMPCSWILTPAYPPTVGKQAPRKTTNNQSNKALLGRSAEEKRLWKVALILFDMYSRPCLPSPRSHLSMVTPDLGHSCPKTGSCLPIPPVTEDSNPKMTDTWGL